MEMRAHRPLRWKPEEKLYHEVFQTVLYAPKKEGPALTRLYCSKCERVLFEGEMRSLRDRIKFRIAESVGMDHIFLGHEVVYVRPQRAL